MRDNNHIQQQERSAFIGQLAGAVIAVALLGVIGAQVPDLMIWILQ
ncbi:hypothetical protein [Pseudomonas sp. UBA4194]|nr:hypothetical protein [Pseudomonas sp. UBA4194]